MKITLISAVSENNVIGIENIIPWRIKEDMLRFKELTLNHPVIMGRKTYESFPEKFRPLPGRKNIVLSNTWKKQNGIYVAKSVHEALNETENKDSYVIGGEKVYRDFLPIADEIELTIVHSNFEGDTFFPEVRWNEWVEVYNSGRRSTKSDLKYSFLTYKRK